MMRLARFLRAIPDPLTPHITGPAGSQSEAEVHVGERELVAHTPQRLPQVHALHERAELLLGERPGRLAAAQSAPQRGAGAV